MRNCEEFVADFGYNDGETEITMLQIQSDNLSFG